MVDVVAPYSTYEQEKQAEDWQDEIYILSPVDNPVASMSRTMRATGVNHNWSEDALKAAGKNARVEGANAQIETAQQVLMRNNNCQIMDKTAEVSGTLEEVDKYGRDSEMAYQLELRYGELANDEEVAIIGTFDGAWQTKVDGAPGPNGTGGTPREMAALRTQLDSGNQFDGSAVADLTALEEMILDAHETCYNEGATPSYLLTSPSGARYISNFLLSAGRQRDIRNERRLVNVIDLYVSNYGELDVVMDRHLVDVNTTTGAHTQRRDFYLLDFNHLATPVLRPTRDWPLAKQGDSDRRQVLREATYAVLHAKSCAVVEAVPAGLAPA